MPTVRDPSNAVTTMGRGWPLIGALLAGTDAMRDAGERYLPRWPNESETAYGLRLKTATLFPAFARTVEVLAGKPFSRPVTLGDGTPAQIEGWCENIDLQGRDLHAFASDLTRGVLAHGIRGILVDYPETRGGLRTKAQERAAGVRPFFVEIAATDIIGWRQQRINGAEVLTQLRLLETKTEPDGEFGDKEIEQVRVLTPGAWQVWRKVASATGEVTWQLHEAGTTTLRRIPFVPVYGMRSGFMRAAPPLMELAHLNVEHWQSKSDQQTILHVARVPILFGKNLGDAEIVVGASSAVQADGPEADLKFVEHSGAAIEAGRTSLRDLEDLMRQVGAELLVIKPGNTSVVQTRADNEPGMCALQRIMQDVEDALENALSIMGEWIGTPADVEVSIYQEFGVGSLGEGALELLRAMNVDGTFSDESLFAEAQRRGIVRPELVWAEEKTRIAANIPKPGAKLQD